MDNILDLLGEKKSIALLHHNADPDAVGSAAALKLVIPELDIGCPVSVSNAGKRVAKALGIEILLDPDLGQYEQFVVLDTSTPVQLGDLLEGVKDPIVIDHHTSSGLWKASVEIIDPTSSSCAEIIFDIFKRSDVLFTPEIGIALMAGIISDTGRFRFASAKTFAIVSEIMDRTGLSSEEVMVNRLTYTNVGEDVIVSSHVGSYEAAAARVLLITGGDVVFVSNNKKKELRISARAKPHIVKKGVHLGEFMSKMGEKLNCQGGGHPGAAGMNGKGDPEIALGTLVDEMRALLSGLASE